MTQGAFHDPTSTAGAYVTPDSRPTSLEILILRLEILILRIVRVAGGRALIAHIQQLVLRVHGHSLRLGQQR